MASKTYSFNPSTDIPSLNGKVILITGANTGLGKATALELAKHSPSRIIMTCRSPTKGNAALEEVRSTASPGTRVSLVQLDLSSFASVRSAAREIHAQAGDGNGKLHVLVLNAGVMGCPPALTPEGYEVQMGTNLVGHVLLLKLLRPLLHRASAAGEDARVVHLASAGVRYVGPGGVEYDTLRSASSGTSMPLRYAQSKLACLLYAREDAKRDARVRSVAINPGEVDTELFTREAGDEHMKKLQTDVVPNVVGPISEGVKNHLWASTSDEIVSGGFYEPVGVVGEVEGIADDEKCSRLWEWVEKELEGQAI